MRIYSFTLAGARFAYLMVITLVSGVVIRLTNYSKRITIDGDTFYPVPGLEIGDYTESNNGEVSSLTFKVATKDGGLFTQEDIDNHLFDRAQASLYITDARTPTLADLEVTGTLKGKVEFDPLGNASFEFLNKFNLERDVGGRKYTIEDWAEFGDPRWNKIPTFPTVDETSDDLTVVQRNTAYSLGERRWFDYDDSGDPDTYHGVYVEATTAGTTAGSAPVSPSDTPGDTITDGTAVWTVRDSYAKPFVVASIIDDTHITITVDEPRASGVPSWFQIGSIWMRSGYLTGFQTRLNYWNGSSQIGMVFPYGGLLEVGDKGFIAPGYDQSLDQAADLYGTALTSVTEPHSADGGVLNYRGFPHITGARLMTSTIIPGVTPDSEPDADDPGGGGGGGGEGEEHEAFWVEFLDGSS